MFGSAERALQIGNKPIAVFASLVGKGLRQNINQSQEDRAKERIDKLQGKGKRDSQKLNHPDIDKKKQLDPESLADTLTEAGR